MVIRIYFIVVLLLLPLFAQEYNVLSSFDGKRVALLLTVAPEFDEQIVVSRRSPGGNFEALNDSLPLRPSEEITQIIELLGNDVDDVLEYSGADDLNTIDRYIMGNNFKSSIISLLFPGAAQAAGRLFYDNTASAGATYEYKIEYRNIYGRVLQEVTKTVKAVSVPPSAPTSLSSEISGSVLSLEWDYPKWENDMSNLATRFNVYKKDSLGVFVKVNQKIILRNDASKPVYRELIKSNEENAVYYVTAVDILGVESQPSKSISVKLISNTIPDPPPGLVSQVNKSSVLLVWSEATDPSVAGYNVYRREKGKQDSLKLNKKLIEKTSPLFEDVTPKPAVIYYYYVTSVTKNNKESRLSSLAVGEILDTVPPLPPSGLKHSLVGQYIKLEWKASPSSDIKQYVVYRGESREIIARIGKTTTTTFIDSGYDGKTLLPGKYYYYTVSAVDKVDLEGMQSDTLFMRYVDRVPPRDPAPITAKVMVGEVIEVRVGMTPDPDAAKVNIYRKSTAPGSKTQLLTTLRSLPAVITDSTGKLLETYIYSAEAIDSAGNKSTQTSSNAVTLKDLLIPAAVPHLDAVLNKKGGVTVTWVAVFENDLAGYNVYRSLLPNGNFELLNSKPVKDTRFTDATGDMTYFYKIRAVDTSGNESDWSEPCGVVQPLEIEPGEPDVKFE